MIVSEMANEVAGKCTTVRGGQEDESGVQTSERFRSLSSSASLLKTMKEGTAVNLLRKLTDEIHKLHSKNEFHGKLTPSAIYIDFGSSEVFIEPSRDGPSDQEWAPSDQSNPEKWDVFALGCIFYFVLTGGDHPFGKEGHRTGTISRNLYLLKECKNPLAEKLIEKMIAFEAEQRPSISEVLKHPLFWSEEQIAEFLKDVAGRFESDENLKEIDQFNDQVIRPSSTAIIKRQKKVDVKNNSQILTEIQRLQDTNSILYWHKLFFNLLPTAFFLKEKTNAKEDCKKPHQNRNLLIAESFENVAIKGMQNQCQMKFGRLANQLVYVLKISKISEDRTNFLNTLNQMKHVNNENVLPFLNSFGDCGFSYMAIPSFNHTLFTYDVKTCEVKEILYQITRGLVALHEKGIVHGSLSPREVVVLVKSDQIVAKITKLVIGDDDWGLPAASKIEDIRRLGCIAYWLLSGGHHPFGESEDRPSKLQSNEYAVEGLQPAAEHLVLTMIDPITDVIVQDENKLQSSAVLFHPFFWSHGKVISFFQAAGENSPYFDVYDIKWPKALNSKLKDWLLSHKLNPQTNVEAIKLFVSIVYDHEKGKCQLSAKLAANFPRCFMDAWVELYPELLLRTWIGLQKHKDTEDLAGFYPSYKFHPLETFCKFDNTPKEKLMICQPTDLKSADFKEFLNKANSESVECYFRKKLEIIRQNPKQLLKKPLDDRQRTALHLASHSDKLIYFAEQLTSLGSADVIDVQDADGFTPLHFAVYTNSYQVAKLLVEKNASVNIAEKLYGLTPLLMAMLREVYLIATLLLDCETIHVNSRNLDGRTALHMAVAKKNLEMVKYLLRVRGIKVNAQDKFGCTPLHFAAGNNALQIVKILLKHGADICVRENQGLTPLDVAIIKRCDIKLINSLLSRSSKIEKNAPDDPQNSALHIAVHQGWVEVVRLLLNENAKPNLQNDAGQSPLHAALQFSGSQRHLEIVQILLRVSNPNLEDRNKLNGLLFAVYYNAVEAVECLLKDDRVKIEAQHPVWKSTALHMAAAFNRTEITKILLERGANLEARDINGETPFYYAAFHDSVGVMKLFIEKCAAKCAEFKMSRGRTLLHVAASQNSVNVGKLLIDAGADVNAQDDFGLTPLHYAKLRKHRVFVDEVLRKQPLIDLNVESKQLSPDNFDGLEFLTYFSNLNLGTLEPDILVMDMNVNLNFNITLDIQAYTF